MQTSKNSNYTGDRLTERDNRSEAGTPLPGSFAPDNVRDKTAILVLNEILKG